MLTTDKHIYRLGLSSIIDLSSDFLVVCTYGSVRNGLILKKKVLALVDIEPKKCEGKNDIDMIEAVCTVNDLLIVCFILLCCITELLIFSYLGNISTGRPGILHMEG